MEMKFFKRLDKDVFLFIDDDIQVGELEVSSENSKELSIHRVEVYACEKGRGVEKKVLEQVYQYAKDHSLKLFVLCDYFNSLIDAKMMNENFIVE